MSGSLWRAGLDGTGAELLCSSTGSIQRFTIDEATAKLYWTEASPNNRVIRTDLDCSSQEILVDVPGNTFGGIWIDAASGKLFWADFGSIHIADLDGSNQTTICFCGNDNIAGIGFDTSVGACGMPDGSCVASSTRDDCPRLEGFWLGDGSECLTLQGAGVPAVSGWGLGVFTLALLAAATLLMRHRRAAIGLHVVPGSA